MRLLLHRLFQTLWAFLLGLFFWWGDVRIAVIIAITTFIVLLIIDVYDGKEYTP